MIFQQRDDVNWLKHSLYFLDGRLGSRPVNLTPKSVPPLDSKNERIIMPANREMTFSIYRFDPESGKAPYMQDFVLNTNQIKGAMLLNALEAIKET